MALSIFVKAQERDLLKAGVKSDYEPMDCSVPVQYKFE